MKKFILLTAITILVTGCNSQEDAFVEVAQFAESLEQNPDLLDNQNSEDIIQDEIFFPTDDIALEEEPVQEEGVVVNEEESAQEEEVVVNEEEPAQEEEVVVNEEEPSEEEIAYEDKAPQNDEPIITDISCQQELSQELLSQYECDGGKKVALCHVPAGKPENAHLIVVGSNSLPAHLRHKSRNGNHTDFMVNCKKLDPQQLKGELAFDCSRSCAIN